MLTIDFILSIHLPEIKRNFSNGSIRFGLFFLIATSNQAIGGTNQQTINNQFNNCISVGAPINAGTGGITANVPLTFSNPLCNLASNGSLSTTDAQNLTPDQIFSMGYQSMRVTGGKINLPDDYFRLKRNANSIGAAGDDDFSRLNFWAKTDNDFGSLTTTLNSSGYKYDNHNFVFGADYRLQNNWVAGGSFSYQNNNAAFAAGRGTTNSNNYTGNLYSTYNLTDALHVELNASYGGFNYDTNRNIVLSSLGSSVAHATPNGNQYAFSLGGGYDLNYQALSITPYLRGDYINLAIDAYSESGSIAAMHFANQSIQSMVSTLGLQSAYTFNFSWGVLIPQLRGEWHHQYLDGQNQVQANFVSASSQVFTLTGNAPSRDYYTVGAEVSSVLPGGVSAFLAYETLQGYSTVNSNRFILGMRLEFD